MGGRAPLALTHHPRCAVVEKNDSSQYSRSYIIVQSPSNASCYGKGPAGHCPRSRISHQPGLRPIYFAFADVCAKSLSRGQTSVDGSFWPRSPANAQVPQAILSLAFSSSQGNTHLTES